MKLVLGVTDCWRKVDVLLQDGCLPSIAGHVLPGDCVEHASWFKVLVLDCISIDCTQRVISWTSLSNSQPRSLMAPNEGNSPAAWTDELASVFELAEALVEATNVTNTRHQQVEHKTWARLLNSYLLPLISFTASDLPSLQLAQSQHTLAIAQLDQILSETTSRTMKVKEELAEMQTAILPCALEWAENGQCTCSFLKLVIDDVRGIEDNIRAKIQCSTQCASSTRSELNCEECLESEQLLVDMLTLRSQLHKLLVTMVESPSLESRDPTQDKYAKLHTELSQLRDTGLNCSERKVLALSVREALDKAVHDVGKCGHSTDLLPRYISREYKTLRERLLIVLSMPSTDVALKHKEFCSNLRGSWFDDFVVVECSRPLFPTKQWLTAISLHFNNESPDFLQRMQLAYEKIFFDLFHKDVIALYLSSGRKYCQALQLTALGVSMLTPDSILPPHVSALFPPRTFTLTTQLYQQVTGQVSTSIQQLCTQEYINHFGGMTFDLESLSHVCSPMEKLQLLTSAFRKCMTALSGLQSNVVNCDDLLPVLVMVLLRAHPSILATIHVNTKFLNDFIAPFLASGCHGYSLTSFSSVIQIISEL